MQNVPTPPPSDPGATPPAQPARPALRLSSAGNTNPATPVSAPAQAAPAGSAAVPSAPRMTLNLPTAPKFNAGASAGRPGLKIQNPDELARQEAAARAAAAEAAAAEAQRKGTPAWLVGVSGLSAAAALTFAVLLYLKV